MPTPNNDDIVKQSVHAPSDEEIIRANIAHILAHPAERYPHNGQQLTAVEVIQAGIEERRETVRHHALCYGDSPNKWSREVTNRLEREIRLMQATLEQVATSSDAKKPPAGAMRAKAG